MFSRDQLKRAASLTEEDFVHLGKCRRPHNRLGFAYQVGFVRLFGRFPQQQPFELFEELVCFSAAQLRLDGRKPVGASSGSLRRPVAFKPDPGVHRLLAGVGNLPGPQSVRPGCHWNRSLPGVDPTVVSPGAISITATPIAYSCRDRIGHKDSRVPKSAGSAQRSRGVSASLANAAAPVVSESSTY